MYTFNQIEIEFCVLRMLEIFSWGHELEVEGDDSGVVVSIEKRETDSIKKMAKKMEEAGVVPM